MIIVMDSLLQLLSFYRYEETEQAVVCEMYKMTQLMQEGCVAVSEHLEKQKVCTVYSPPPPYIHVVPQYIRTSC